MEVNGPKIVFRFDLFGHEMIISETIVLGWFVMFIITALILFLTHNMQKIPTKRQAIAEWIVETVYKTVDDTMGKGNRIYAPYMATIFAFSIFGSLISMIGLRPVTGDFNTTLGWALMTFAMITYAKIKTNGFFGYLKSFADPIPLTPLNIISEIATPVSMSFRHFGNVAGGMIITSLLYYALKGISSALGMSIPFLTIGIPAVLSVYFDLFSGFMQAFIFMMLSMVYIGSARETE